MDSKTRQYEGNKWHKGLHQAVSDALAVEHPLAVFVNDVMFTLTMQTPGDEWPLALGLLFTEGVYKDENIPAFEARSIKSTEYIDEIRVRIADKLVAQSALNKRNLLSSSSCGICGSTELPILHGSIELDMQFTEIQISNAFEMMSERQNAFLISGGCHGAAAFDSSLQLLAIKEDIGRHNAVDKLAGQLRLDGQFRKARLLTVSGRVSFEIVYKCFAMGIPYLAAVSAPSSLAVDYCKELGIRLYGFCREDRLTRYA